MLRAIQHCCTMTAAETKLGDAPQISSELSSAGCRAGMSGSSISRNSFHNLIAGAGPLLWESHIARHCAELLQETPRLTAVLLCAQNPSRKKQESLWNLTFPNITPFTLCQTVFIFHCSHLNVRVSACLNSSFHRWKLSIFEHKRNWGM